MTICGRKPLLSATVWNWPLTNTLCQERVFLEGYYVVNRTRKDKRLNKISTFSYRAELKDRTVMCNGFHVSTNTILYNYKKHSFFFFLWWLLNQVVVLYAVDIGKGEMLVTESKGQCNRPLGGAHCVVWFLGWTHLLYTSSQFLSQPLSVSSWEW